MPPASLELSTSPTSGPSFAPRSPLLRRAFLGHRRAQYSDRDACWLYRPTRTSSQGHGIKRGAPRHERSSVFSSPVPVEAPKHRGRRAALAAPFASSVDSVSARGLLARSLARSLTGKVNNWLLVLSPLKVRLRELRLVLSSGTQAGPRGLVIRRRPGPFARRPRPLPRPRRRFGPGTPGPSPGPSPGKDCPGTDRPNRCVTIENYRCSSFAAIHLRAVRRPFLSCASSAPSGALVISAQAPRPQELYPSVLTTLRLPFSPCLASLPLVRLCLTCLC